MKRKRKEPGGETGINLTPVLSLAFILLAFVVVVVPFTRERGFDFGYGWGGWHFCMDCCWITVSVDNHNRIFVEDRGGPKEVEVRAVKDNLARRLAEHPRCGVLVQAHGDSDMGTVIRIVDQAKRARDRPPVAVSVATVD